LKVGGFIEVYFPSGMTAPGSELNNKKTVTTNTEITANDDSWVTITSVTLPSSSGAYGPFRIITR
jgi:hypothetical protein